MPLNLRLGARSTQLYLAPLDLSGEVFEVLAHLALGVRDGFGHHLPNPTARRVSVVHRYVYARAAGGDLLEAYLAGGVYLALDAVPADTALGAHLGGPGVELHGLAQRPLDPPVARLVVDHAHFLDVRHDRGEVLQVRPVGKDVL